MRGKHYSKPIEQVVDEAKRLGDAGVRELVIVAQDTTYYGKDLYGEPRLRQLLGELDQIDTMDWIRLMYFYPMYIDDALIDTLAGAERILPYIDMPLQHASDTMLKRMSRKTTRAIQEEILGRLRSRIDDLVMRTTMITGFPGETDDDFDQLAEFVSEQRFEHLGVFTYSVEEDTPAARLPDRVAPDVMQQRHDRLMAIQQQIAFEWTREPRGVGRAGDHRFALPRAGGRLDRSQPRRGTRYRWHHLRLRVRGSTVGSSRFHGSLRDGCGRWIRFGRRSPRLKATFAWRMLPAIRLAPNSLARSARRVLSLR